MVPIDLPTPESLGLPECKSIRLLYNASSSAIVAWVELAQTQLPIWRLYWRRAGDATYLPVDHVSEHRSQVNPVVADAPALFFITQRLRLLPIGDAVGTWEGIWRLDLETGALASVG